nr:FecR domain-containing protein [Deltaproteobacteria bacterium]
MPMRQRAILFLLGLLILFSAASMSTADPLAIGAVSSITGDVQVIREGEVKGVALALGSKIYQYDTIETAKRSKVRITFEDGSLLNLSEETALQIKEHIYMPQENKRVSLLSLLKGKLRVLCGHLSGRDSRYDVHTPTAVIGIRGTEFIVWVVNEELTAVICLENRVSVHNSDSAVTGEVILDPNQMTRIRKGMAPLPASTAPDVLRKQLETETTPIVVSPSAIISLPPLPVPARIDGIHAPEAFSRPPVPKASNPLERQRNLPELPPIPQDPAETLKNLPPKLPSPPPPPGPGR